MKLRRLIPVFALSLLLSGLAGCGSSPKALLLKGARAIANADTVEAGVSIDGTVSVDNPIYPVDMDAWGDFEITAVRGQKTLSVLGNVGTTILKRDISFPLEAYAREENDTRSAWYVYFPLQGSSSHWEKLTVSTDRIWSNLDLKQLSAVVTEFADGAGLTEVKLGAKECYKLTGTITGSQLKTFELGKLGYRIDGSAVIQVSALLEKKTCAPVKLVLTSDGLLSSPIDVGEYVTMDVPAVSVVINMSLSDGDAYIELPADARNAESCTDLGDGLNLNNALRGLLGLG